MRLSSRLKGDNGRGRSESEVQKDRAKRDEQYTRECQKIRQIPPMKDSPDKKTMRRKSHFGKHAIYRDEGGRWRWKRRGKEKTDQVQDKIESCSCEVSTMTTKDNRETQRTSTINQSPPHKKKKRPRTIIIMVGRMNSEGSPNLKRSPVLRNPHTGFSA